MPQLNWIGKDKVINHDKELPFRVLKPVKEFSCGENSDNLLIEGDNLEALKALMPFYYGKVKCIYIDPPYNTGNEGWIYNDRVNSPQIKQWLHKVVASEGEDLCRHDKWLCMIYPRLKLLHQLLSENGVIFISIDDNEVHNLRLVMDEIFGSKNFVATITVQINPRGRSLDRFIAKTHEYILLYAKNVEKDDAINLIPKEGISLQTYNKKDEKGIYRELTEACDFLCGMYGLTNAKNPDQRTGGKNLTKLNISKVSYTEQKPQYVPPTEKDYEVYNLFYEKCLPLSADGERLLSDKGFTAATISQFGWRTISREAVEIIKKTFTDEEVKASGIAGLFYPGWLLIPFWQDEKISYLRCRNAAKKDFRNLIGKITQPYNYNALYGLTSSNSLYICEGETDTMTLAQNDYSAIGILGATQNETVRRVSDLITEGFGTDIEIILVFDNDEQGNKATELARKEFTSRGCIPKRLKIPPQYKDINDYCNNRPLTTQNEK